MSSPFTTPTSGTQLSSLDFWNEIQTAYSERRQALNQSVVSAFVADDYWQKLSNFTAWQNWLQGECVHFLNHTVEPIVTIEGFAYYTVPTWRLAAGIPAGGFSRYDMNGNLLGYGVAQAGDAICANTLTELQNGFSALRWTLMTAQSSEDTWVKSGQGYSREAYDLAWAAATWDYLPIDITYMQASVAIQGTWSGTRTKNKIKAVSVPIFRPSAPYFYAHVDVHAAQVAPPYEWDDFESGYTPDIYVLLDWQAESQEEIREIDYPAVFAADDNPMTLSAGINGHRYSMKIGAMYCLLKWNVTNQNTL